MNNIQQIFSKKTELLCKGLYLDKDFIKHYKEEGINLDFGRKGGAGPLGGRYFLFEDNSALVNVALWDDAKKSNLVLKKKHNNYFEIYNRDSQSKFCKLKLVKNPKYYSPEYKTSDGIEMRKIALVHGVDCLATTIYQKCKYWACGEACKFCGIELSLKYDTTILEKNAKQISEVIDAARAEERCSHMTLTSGTEESSDKGANRYIDILKGLKEFHPDIPLHVQIEPMENISYIDRLKKAGADTIGIHIELLDENLRRKITPGKAHIPHSLFKKNWEHSVDVFGKNQVESFVLMGFNIPKMQTLRNLEEMISIGVIPFITPVRAIPLKDSITPTTDHNFLTEIYKKTANLMHKYKVNPLKNKAGCVRCGGCSAINEAYRANLF